jgi:hypothetical protein
LDIGCRFFDPAASSTKKAPDCGFFNRFVPDAVNPAFFNRFKKSAYPLPP